MYLHFVPICIRQFDARILVFLILFWTLLSFVLRYSIIRFTNQSTRKTDKQNIRETIHKKHPLWRLLLIPKIYSKPPPRSLDIKERKSHFSLSPEGRNTRMPRPFPSSLEVQLVGLRLRKGNITASSQPWERQLVMSLEMGEKEIASSTLSWWYEDLSQLSHKTQEQS